MNIKKISLAVAGVLLLVGCASEQGVVKNAEVKSEVTKQEVSFIEDNGSFIIGYDKNGNWSYIEVTGMAKNNDDLILARRLARADAYRNISEWLNSSVSSTTSTDSTTKTLSDNSLVGKTIESKKPNEDVDVFGDKIIADKTETSLQNNESRTKNNKTYKIVKEFMSQNSASLIKGARPISTKIDKETNMIAVTFRLDANDIKASKTAVSQMEGR